MTATGVIALVFGASVFVLGVAAFFFNAGANLVKSHYTEEKRRAEEVAPRI